MARPVYINDIKYKNSSVKQKYNPLKTINRKENQEHRINFETIHDSLLNASIKQCKQMEADQGWQNIDYSTLHGTEIIETENRKVQIKWVNIPTFTKENKAQFYIAFFVNIDWYKITDLKQIHALCLNQINQKQMEGHGSFGNRGRYTIFLSGKQLGRTNYKTWNITCRKYHTFKVNTYTSKGNKRSCVDVRQGIFKTLANLFYQKLARIKQVINEGWHYYKGNRNQHHIYGQLEKDFKRLKLFMETLRETFFTYRKRYWRLKKIDIPKDKYSNNIRKQTEQYLKLCSATKNKVQKPMFSQNEVFSGG